MDALPISVIARGLPFPTDDKGGYTLLPTGFGLPRVSQVAGFMIHRMARGKADWGEVLSAVTMAVIPELVPISAGDFATGEVSMSIIYALAPTVTKPVFAGAFGKNAFGMDITPNTPSDQPKYDTYYPNTPDFYISLAKFAAKNLGLDQNPEIYKHYAESYLVGPLSLITSSITNDSAYRTGKELYGGNQVADSLLRGLGVTSVMGNYNTITRNYYDTSARIDSIIRKAGGIATDPKNSGDAAAAAQLRADTLLANGATWDQVSAYEIMHNADGNLRQINREITALTRQVMAGDVDETAAGILASELKTRKEAIMLQFNDTVKYLNWR
jgi:hypothetical protein